MTIGRVALWPLSKYSELEAGGTGDRVAGREGADDRAVAEVCRNESGGVTLKW